MRIIVLGPQGSGKTTQAELLSQHINLPLIDAGTLIRQFVEHDPDHKEAEQVRRALVSGNMVPNGLAGRLVKEAVEREGKSGFVLDGYPRSREQLAVYEPPTDIVFYLRLSEAVCVERLFKRGRADDTPESIKRRLSLYHELTEPLLAYYRARKILVEVDGDRSIEEIQADMRASLL